MKPTRLFLGRALKLQDAALTARRVLSFIVEWTIIILTFTLAFPFVLVGLPTLFIGNALMEAGRGILIGGWNAYDAFTTRKDGGFFAPGVTECGCGAAVDVSEKGARCRASAEPFQACPLAVKEWKGCAPACVAECYPQCAHERRTKATEVQVNITVPTKKEACECGAELEVRASGPVCAMTKTPPDRCPAGPFLEG